MKSFSRIDWGYKLDAVYYLLSILLKHLFIGWYSLSSYCLRMIFYLRLPFHMQIRISEMLLGKVPDGFTFAPKHKSNAYDRAENGWFCSFFKCWFWWESFSSQLLTHEETCGLCLPSLVWKMLEAVDLQYKELFMIFITFFDLGSGSSLTLTFQAVYNSFNPSLRRGKKMKLNNHWHLKCKQ